MKKIIKVLAVLTMVSTGQLLAITSNTPVQAAQVENPKRVTDKAWTKKLANAGYVFELPHATKGALYKNTAANGGKSYSKKVLKKLVKNHTLFKVKRLSTIKNGISVDLVSKDGKYKGYTNYINGIRNKNLSNKALQPLIKAELRVMTAKDSNEPTSDLLNQVQVLASKLTGKNRKIANTSVKQLKQFLKNNTLSETPVLLIGKYPDGSLEK
ncbi:hypothetical protein OZX56_00325 [Lactobacillus sp. ESL0684]|uniref:hypothetical protein n=1 Tax=Lactobacillus sp. ESL0684 TaxID=2983213 RepID=UPI0023F9871C|nr:hypothetical protein [Lactobacillus sp. ESL0684]WEV43719.1 hypothetical protein OZX56_00325 [Lactobacillus sp. ESL0684]